MATSKAQYHREVMDTVLAAVGLRKTQAHLEHDYLRSRIDALADHIELLAGVADFWLDLDKKEGPARRRAPDPKSPFRERGRHLIAAKSRIADWDLAWRMKAIAQILAQSKSEKGRSAASEFLRTRVPMLTWCDEAGDRIVGHAAMLPASAEQLPIEQLDVVWLRPDQALRRRWLDRKEAHDFLALFRAAQRHEADALELIQREFNTAIATGARDPRDGRL